jgi:hypothetical protein
VVVAAWIVAGVLHSTSLARAQCSQWSPAFKYSGTSDLISALTVFDDGTGPALYAARQSSTDDSAFGFHPLPAAVSRWTGTQWVPLGSGLAGIVLTLTVHDDGGGPALYAGGALTVGTADALVARWSGSGWTVVGPAGYGYGAVRAFAVFDDGSGPALYAGGYFIYVGSVAAHNVAKWDGASWSPLGSGTSSSSGYGLFALASFDDGSGPALYAGGAVTTAGGSAASGIAKWDGAAWSPVGGGVTDVNVPIVTSLTAFDPGSGPVLCVGGLFHGAGGLAVSNIATWSSGGWADLGAGLPQGVGALAVVPEAGSQVLVAGGQSGTNQMMPQRWNGTSWSLMGGGLGGPIYYYGSWAGAFAIYDEGNGPSLIAGGGFQNSGSAGIHCLARWNGSDWLRFGSGPDDAGVDSTVRACVEFDDGTGAALWVSGRFVNAGGAHCQRLAQWDGTNWTSAGWGGVSNLPDIYTLRVLDLGSGPELCVGAGNGVYRRNAGTWTNLGSTQAPVRALERFDSGSGPQLHAGGTFQVIGGTQVNAIARWNGTTWSSVGGGMNGEVFALLDFDAGSGTRLYAGGAFTTSGGVSTNYLARWDGTTWSSVGGGLNGHVYSLLVHDDGSGPALYVGGAFTLAGGVPANYIARWNGIAWSPLGSGLDGIAASMLSFDDGSGPALYATGTFSSAGGASANSIARWDGANWIDLGGGITDIQPHQNLMGSTLAAYDAGLGSGPHLYVGGSFGTAGGLRSSCIAEWGVCANQGVPLCFGDGSGHPCPCSNNGAPGHGCANSAVPGGALLSTSGATVPDTIVLTSSGEPPSSLSVFLQGRLVLTAGVTFGDGVRCASGTIARLFVRTASTGTVSVPADGDPTIRARSAALGDPVLPGERRYYQTYYRDGNPSFCPPPTGSSFNVTNAVKIVW